MADDVDVLGKFSCKTKAFGSKGNDSVELSNAKGTVMFRTRSVHKNKDKRKQEDVGKRAQTFVENRGEAKHVASHVQTNLSFQRASQTCDVKVSGCTVSVTKMKMASCNKHESRRKSESDCDSTKCIDSDHDDSTSLQKSLIFHRSQSHENCTLNGKDEDSSYDTAAAVVTGTKRTSDGKGMERVRRKRVLHDYRRLSNAGYLDVGSKKVPLSFAGEIMPEMDVVLPSPQKVLPIKIKLPKPLVNSDEQSPTMESMEGLYLNY